MDNGGCILHADTNMVTFFGIDKLGVLFSVAQASTTETGEPIFSSACSLDKSVQFVAVPASPQGVNPDATTIKRSYKSKAKGVCSIM